jgi:hypothetical protein
MDRPALVLPMEALERDDGAPAVRAKPAGIARGRQGAVRRVEIVVLVEDGDRRPEGREARGT